MSSVSVPQKRETLNLRIRPEERNLIDRAAKARGKRLGRQTGERPKSDRLAPKVMALTAQGRSYRWIARDLGISKNTVADIIHRHKSNDTIRISTPSGTEP